MSTAPQAPTPPSPPLPPALDAERTLALWERGAALHPIDRAALLCAAARPDTAPADVADLPLGAVTESLLRLRVAGRGASFAGHVDCPRCGQRLAIELDLAPLIAPVEVPATAPASTEVAGVRLRAPTLRDLAAVADEPDPGRAARGLLARLSSDGAGATRSDDLLAAADAALEALDPHADIALALHCAACGQAVMAQLDAAALLWDEIDAQARLLTREVDLLARTYGWTEREVLGLGAARRARYVALASA
jgi:hypothetical protein